MRWFIMKGHDVGGSLSHKISSILWINGFLLSDEKSPRILRGYRFLYGLVPGGSSGREGFTGEEIRPSGSMESPISDGSPEFPESWYLLIPGVRILPGCVGAHVRLDDLYQRHRIGTICLYAELLSVRLPGAEQ